MGLERNHSFREASRAYLKIEYFTRIGGSRVTQSSEKWGSNNVRVGSDSIRGDLRYLLAIVDRGELPHCKYAYYGVNLN